MLAFLFVLLNIAFAQQSTNGQSSLTNGGDKVQLSPQGADMMITAAMRSMNQSFNGAQSAAGNATSSDQMINLFVEMWFDKIEELGDNDSVIFSIDDLAQTKFDLSSDGEVDLDSRTRATRFNFSLTLSNGAKLVISVYPNFTSLRNTTDDDDDDSSSSSPTVPMQSSSVGSPVASSPQASSVQQPPPSSSPVSPVVNATGHSLQQIGFDNNKKGDLTDRVNRSSVLAPNQTDTRRTVLNDGTVIPHSALKFSIWCTNWPFADNQNTLRIGVILTAPDSENGTGRLEGRTYHAGSGFIISAPSAFYDGTKSDVTTRFYRNEANEGVQWTFHSFENDLLYDPVFGYESGALHVLPSIATILLIFVMSMLRL